MSGKAKLASAVVWSAYSAILCGLVYMAARAGGWVAIGCGLAALLMLVLPFWLMAEAKALADELADEQEEDAAAVSPSDMPGEDRP